MVIKMFFTEEEIRAFFISNGYKIVTSDFGNWCHAYHNQSEWCKYTADGVVVGDKVYEASKLFEQVTESRLKRLVTPSNEGMKNLIVKESKKLK